MKTFRALAASAAAIAVALGGTAYTVATSAPAQAAVARQAPAQAGRPWPTGCSSTYFMADPRLGPAVLPAFGPVGTELFGYDRTGGMPVRKFLRTYYDPAANHGQGSWIYPPENGFVIRPNGKPEEFTLRLNRGAYIDRFGSEHGSFLSPAGMSYAARSIPPQNLDGTSGNSCDYYDYRVIKSFRVDAGPVAAWFGQPGGGLQYQLDARLVPGAPNPLSVGWLVAKGYLSRAR